MTTLSQPRRGPEEFNPLAGLLAIALPGAGHAYLGERRRAAYIALGVLGLFFGGIFIGGVDVIDRKEDPIWFFGQALVGPIPFGINWYHQNRLKGYDISSGEFRSARPHESRVIDGGRPILIPTEQGMPGPPNSKSIARMNEIGTLYATIAGMLNLIAILDAAFHRKSLKPRTTRIAGATLPGDAPARAPAPAKGATA